MNKKLSLFLLSAPALCVGLLLGSQLVERGASAQRTNPSLKEGEWGTALHNFLRSTVLGEGPWIVVNSEDKPFYFRRPKAD